MKYSIDEIDQAAAYVISAATSRTLLFDAPMGAGKTTLITAICRQLGVTDPISSPTFNIVNEYQGKGHKIYHFDLYRIESIDELYDIGVEDYFDANSYKLIEWPEIIIPITTEFQKVNLELVDKSHRIVRVNDVVAR